VGDTGTFSIEPYQISPKKDQKNQMKQRQLISHLIDLLRKLLQLHFIQCKKLTFKSIAILIIQLRIAWSLLSLTNCLFQHYLQAASFAYQNPIGKH
jgi:hypothetical protein